MTEGKRDTDAMRERILEAGMEEFAAYGLAGARVDRIAATAAINKNSLYRYFASKDELFAAVLHRHLDHVLDDVPFSADDLPGFAVRLFDYAMDRPQLMRLVTWSGLERPEIGKVPGQGAHQMSDKFARLRELQRDGRLASDVPPAVIFMAITAISTAWTAVNPFWSMMDDGGIDREVLRDAIARMVARGIAP
jgi:AcrR family transcriptional regulator